MSDTAPFLPAAEARRLIQASRRASLATHLARRQEPGALPGHPYVSLVLPAWDGTEALLLLSELADHTRNLRADPAASLLLDGTAGLAEPLAGARVTLLGRCAPDPSPAAREAYLAQQPEARAYAGFADFRVWRLQPDAAHLVAGFGRIAWISADQLAA